MNGQMITRLAGLSRFRAAPLTAILTGMVVAWSIFIPSGQAQGAASTIAFTARSRTAKEGQQNVLLTVGRTGSLEEEVRLDYTTLPADISLPYAIPQIDYEITSGQLYFEPGQAFASILVPLINDGILEETEYFDVELSDIEGDAELGSIRRIRVAIDDNDSGVEFTPGVLRYVGERETAVHLIVINGSDGNLPFTVNWRVNSGTAIAGMDYDATSGTLEFMGPESSQTISIPIINDSVRESDESFSVVLTGISGGPGLASRTNLTVRILDDDPGVEFHTDFIGTAEDAGILRIAVPRRAPDDVTYSVAYMIHEVDALDGVDFEASTGRLVFDPGVNERTINIPIINDSYREPNETFRIQLLDLIGDAYWGDRTNLTVNIVDNDEGVQFSSSSSSDFNEHQEQSVIASILRGGDGPDPVSVTLRVTGDTATVGEDFTEEEITVLLNSPSSEIRSGQLGVIDDLIPEPDEQLVLEIISVENGSFANTRQTKEVYIRNDDVGFEMDDVYVGEDVGNAAVVIRRPLADLETHVVEFWTSNRGAVAGLDYLGVTNVITFAPGDYEKIVMVPILNDSLTEPFESVETHVRVLTGMYYTGLHKTGAININDNDPGLGWESTFYSADEGVQSLTLRVARGSDGTNNVSVSYETEDSTAQAGEDFVAQAGTLEFGPSDSFKDITIVLINDILTENPELFLVRLFDPEGTDLGPKALAGISINDNDPGLRWASSQTVIAEDSTLVTLEVLRGADDLAPFSLACFTKDTWNPTTSPADEGLDYIGFTNVVHFAEGQSSAFVEVEILNDILTEDTKVFDVWLDNPSDGRSILFDRTEIFIADNDPGLGWVDEAVEVDESSGSVSLKIRRGADDSAPFTLSYSTFPSSALAGVDFLEVAKEVHFEAGQDEATVTIDIVNDAWKEPTETFLISINDSSPERPIVHPWTNISIRDNDGLEFTKDTEAVDENAGTVTLYVRGGEDSTSGFTVDYYTVDVQATADEDYVSTSGTLEFSPGEAQKPIVIPIINNGVKEDTEAFQVRLRNATGDAALGGRTRTLVWINDNDDAAYVNSAQRVVEDAGEAIVRVERGNDGTNLFSVAYTTRLQSFGTAEAGSDYEAVSGTVLFHGPELFKEVRIPIFNDGRSEGEEYFFLRLTEATGEGFLNGNRSQHLVTIVDNDGPAYITGEYEVVEDAGETVFWIERGNDGTNIFSVDYTTIDDTALAGEDYSAVSGTVVFEGTNRTREVRVLILEDEFVEEPERFYLRLTDGYGDGRLGGMRQQDLHIIDNDTGIELGAAFYRVWENAGQVVVAVDRGTDGTSPVTVTWETEDISAVSGIDYLGGTGTLTFAGAERHRQIVIPLTQDDNREEPIKTFKIHLTMDGPSLLGERRRATVQIDDNDTSMIYVADQTVPNGEASAELLVTREHALNESVSVAWNTADDTAVAGTDYVAGGGYVHFGPGEHTQRIKIALLAPEATEGDPSFRVQLSVDSAKASLIRPTAKITLDRVDAGSTIPPDAMIGFGEHQGTAVTDDGTLLVTGSSTGLQVWHLPTGRLIRTIGSKSINDPVISPDGQTVAAWSGGQLKLWDLNSGQLRRTLVTSWGKIDFSPDSRHLAVGSNDGSITLWDLNNQLPRRTLPDRAFGIGRTDSNKHLINRGDVAFSSSGAGAMLWELTTAEVSMALGHDQSYPLASSPNGRMILLQAGDHTELWNLESRRRIRSLPHAFAGAVSDDGSTVALAAGGSLQIIDIDSQTTLWSNEYDGDVSRIAMSADRTHLAFFVREWDQEKNEDFQTLKMVNLLNLSESDVASRLKESLAMAFSTDGTKLFSSYYDSNWNSRLAAYAVHAFSTLWIRNVNAPDHLAPAPDGQYLAARISDDVFVFNSRNGTTISSWDNNSYSQIAYSSDGSLIFDELDSQGLRAWSAAEDSAGSLQSQTAWPAGLLDVQQVRFSSSGQQLLLGGYGVATAQLVDAARGNVLWQSLNEDSPRALSREHFAFVRDNTIRLRDADSGQWSTPVHVENTGYIQEVLFSPDGSAMALHYWEDSPDNGGSSIETIDIRNTSDGLSQGRIVGRQSQNVRPSWMNADQQLVLLERNGHLTLHNYHSAQSLTTITGFRIPRSISVSPDGRRLVAVHHTNGRSSRPSSVLWDLATGTPLAGYNGDSRINRDWNRLLINEDNRPDWSVHDPSTLLHLFSITPADDQSIYDILPAADGRFLLGRGYHDDSEQVWLWDGANGALLQSWTVNQLEAIGFAPDSKQILIGYWDQDVPVYQLIHLATGASTYLPATDQPTQAFRFSPDGNHLATGGEDLELWDTRTGELIAILPNANVRAENRLRFTTDSKKLLYHVDWWDERERRPHYEVRVISVPDGTMLDQIELDRESLPILAGESLWLIGSSVYDTSGRFLEMLRASSGWPYSGDLSPDGFSVYLNHEGRIGVWDLGYLFRHRLRLMARPEGLHLDWQEGTLQRAPTVNGPWSDLPTVLPPWPINNDAPEAYFRVKGSR